MSDETRSEGHRFKEEATGGVGYGGGAIVSIVEYQVQLLELSKSLIDDQNFDLSIIVSLMACEIATHRSLTHAFRERNIEDLAKPIQKLLPGNNIGNEKIRNLYNALRGDRIQDQSFWVQFKESANWRNDILHMGKHYTQKHAEKSLKAARELVDYLKQRDISSQELENVPNGE